MLSSVFVFWPTWSQQLTVLSTFVQTAALAQSVKLSRGGLRAWLFRVRSHGIFPRLKQTPDLGRIHQGKHCNVLKHLAMEKTEISVSYWTNPISPSLFQSVLIRLVQINTTLF